MEGSGAVLLLVLFSQPDGSLFQVASSSEEDDDDDTDEASRDGVPDLTEYVSDDD